MTTKYKRQKKKNSEQLDNTIPILSGLLVFLFGIFMIITLPAIVTWMLDTIYLRIK